MFVVDHKKVGGTQEWVAVGTKENTFYNKRTHSIIRGGWDARMGCTALPVGTKENTFYNKRTHSILRGVFDSITSGYEREHIL